jgi:hypothetical protein
MAINEPISFLSTGTSFSVTSPPILLGDSGKFLGGFSILGKSRFPLGQDPMVADYRANLLRQNDCFDSFFSGPEKKSLVFSRQHS